MLSPYDSSPPETYSGGSAGLSEGAATFDAFERPFALAVSERWRSAAWFVGLVAVILVLQFLVGAYRTETGNFSDEAAHFLNAVVLRDYLTHGLGQSPFAFAEAYYLNYPKIAPLMWPPLFHVALGLFLLPGWAPHQAALVFLGLMAALTAFRLFRFVGVYSSASVGAVLSLLFLLSPLVIDLSTAVMVDIALTALALEAAWWLARYYVSGETRHILLFGLFASGCCLTKGNGVAITLLPGLLMLATGRLHLLRTRGLYTSAAMVAAMAGPFVYISYRLCDNMGDFTGVGAAHTLTRGLFFAEFLFHELTPVPFALAMLGAAVAIRRAWTWPAALRTIAPAALVSLAVAGVLFHTILPLEYYSGRYVAISVAPLLGLIPLGIGILLDIAGYPVGDRRATAAILLVALFSFALMRSPTVVRRPLGFGQTVEALTLAPGIAGRRLLVISDEPGEGAMVAELAIREAVPAPMIVRGSKLLADGDWMDNHFRTLFGSASETLTLLEDLHIDFLVVDGSPDARQMAYWTHIESVIGSAAGRLVPIYSTHVDPGSGPTRPITVYRVTHRSPGPAKKLRINLRYSIGKVLEK